MSINKIIENLRKEYSAEILLEENAHCNPFVQFEKWMNEAIEAELFDPNAMTLSTATKEGKPSCRIVLLKGFDENGFTFFTNYNSRKGMQLIENPFASLNFFWHDLEKQIRIEGVVEKISEKLSDEYFSIRPRESQIGALASDQSSKIASREELENNVKQLKIEYDDKTIPRPKHWGGFIVKPNYFEFWQGRPSRLHDRLIYEKDNSGIWKIERLSP